MMPILPIDSCLSILHFSPPPPPRPASRRHLPAPLQLLFRTLNRDLCLPNANEDDIAPRLRDKLIAILRAATHSSVYIGQCMQ
jgi:hypothetical protein